MTMVNSADEVVGAAVGTEFKSGVDQEVHGELEDVSIDNNVIEDGSDKGLKVNNNKKVVGGEVEMVEEVVEKVEVKGEPQQEDQVEEEQKQEEELEGEPQQKEQVEEEQQQVEELKEEPQQEEQVEEEQKQEEELEGEPQQEEQVKEEPQQDQAATPQQQQGDGVSGGLGNEGPIEDKITTTTNDNTSPGRKDNVRHAIVNAEKKASSYMMDSRKAWDLSVAVRAEESKNAEITNVIPYERLKEMRAEEGIDMTRKECYLSAEEFQSCFNQDLEAFNKLPMWRRILLKKKVGLF